MQIIINGASCPLVGPRKKLLISKKHHCTQTAPRYSTVNCENCFVDWLVELKNMQHCILTCSVMDETVIPSGKYSERSNMIWGYSALHQLKLSRCLEMQQHNHHKHQCKSAREWVKTKKTHLSLNQIQNPPFWGGPARAQDLIQQKNLAELKRFCEEDRSK